MSAFAIGVPDVPMLDVESIVTLPPTSTGLPEITAPFVSARQPCELTGDGTFMPEIARQVVRSSL